MEEKMFEAQSRLIKATHQLAEMSMLPGSETSELACLIQYDAVSEALEEVTALRRGNH